MLIKDSYDVIIVGAGPAGLFCAYELKKINNNLHILLVEKGKWIGDRDPNHPEDIGTGIGGAGLFSNGALYFTPNAGGFLENWDETEALSLIKHLLETFREFIRINFNESNNRKIENLQTNMLENNLRFKIVDNIYHVGSDNTVSLVSSIIRELVNNEVQILYNTEATDISQTGSQKIVHLVGADLDMRISCDSLVLASGKIGSTWMEKMARNLGIRYEDNLPYVGIRLEMPTENFEEIKLLGHDPKILAVFNDLRVKTHCTCIDGYTIAVSYDDVILVDGASQKFKSSGRTSFNILVRSSDINTDVGREIASNANKLGQGLPIVQYYEDFKARKSSSDPREASEGGTLNNCISSNITSILPDKHVSAIIEFVGRLEKIFPKIRSPSTLVYAPVVEWWCKRIKVNHFMETNVKGVFTIGDGAGISQGITMAAASGILAARGITKIMNEELLV